MKAKVLRENLLSKLQAIPRLKGHAGMSQQVNILGVAVRLRPLIEALKLTKEDMLDLRTGIISWEELTDKSIHQPELKPTPGLEIKYHNTILRMIGFKGKDAPVVVFGDPPKMEGKWIDGREWANALEFAVLYTTADQCRPVLQCVNFNCNKKIELAGADGFRLGITKLDNPGFRGSFVLNREDLKRIIPRLKKSKDCVISKGDKTVKFSIDGQVFELAKLDATFPSYKQLVPKAKADIKFSAWQMHQAVKNLKTIVKDAGGILWLHIDKQQITISAHDEALGESKAVIDCKSPQATKVAINVNYLIPTLKQAGDGIVKMAVGSPSSPIKFEWPGHTAVIMPMFVQWDQ